MLRLCMLLFSLGLSACQRTESQVGRVRVVESSPASDLALIATEMNPFWQVVINKRGIALRGAASPSGSGTTEFPLVAPTVKGANTIWIVGREKVMIEASRQECVRSDGFRFPVKVRVIAGARQLNGCAQQGRDF